jgi:hypothetical protein
VERCPGVVDKAVDPSERVVRRGKQPRHIIFDRDIGLDRDRSRTGCLHRVDNLPRRRVIPEVVDDDVVTAPGEVEGSRSADPPPSARDNRDRPSQLIHGEIIADRADVESEKGRRLPGALWSDVQNGVRRRPSTG